MLCYRYTEKRSTDSSTVNGDDLKKEGEEIGEEGEWECGEEGEGSTSDVTTSLHSQPLSVDSNDETPQLNKTSSQVFLSPCQITAVAKVSEILDSLESVESLYQNKGRVGDAHPQYRTLSFRRKVDALTLWLKVTKGLAQALATMSGWLGVSVILPEMCREEGEKGGGCSMSTSGGGESKNFKFDLEGAGGANGKMFSVGSPKDDFFFNNDPQQSLKRYTSKGGQSSSGGSVQSRGTLQRMFSSYQSVSVEGGTKGPYRGFVDRVLKKRSLSSLMESVQRFISPIQKLCEAALTPVTCNSVVEETDEVAQVSERERESE